jgi:cytidine deaminase
MKIIDQAYELAKQVRLRAYAPYSKFLVGAVIKAKGHETLFAACNVENASYGGAVCGERNAIFQMVAGLGGKVEPEFMVLVTDTPDGALPCGFCRQVMSEFCSPDFPVHIANLKGIQKTYLLKELLPHAFNKADLPK